MVATSSTMLPLGTLAPAFSLPNVSDETTVNLENYSQSKAFVVAFVCNHCPFVLHLREHLAEAIRGYQERGVKVIGISANDVSTHPDDSFEKMVEEVANAGYTFPYLYDESQDVAQSYRAACTPDFFLYDSGHKLVYRGQYDDSRPDNGDPTGADLSAAIDALLAGQPPRENQKNSIGCNIKWKAGNEPDYFNP